MRVTEPISRLSKSSYKEAELLAQQPVVEWAELRVEEGEGPVSNNSQVVAVGIL